MKIKQSVSGNILTTKIGKSTYTQELPLQIKHKSKVLGVHYETCKIGSYRYLKVVHTESGVSIRNFNGGPTKNIKNLIAHLDTFLCLGVWNVSFLEVKSDINEYVARNLGVEYSIKESSYVVERWFVDKNVLENIKKGVELLKGN